MEKSRSISDREQLYSLRQWGGGKTRITFSKSGVGNAPLDLEILALNRAGAIRSDFTHSYTKEEIQQLIQFLNSL